MSSRARRLHVPSAAIWGITDQALSSISNFALTLLAARELTPSDFGGFSLVFAAYLVALGAVRAVAAEPFSVRGPALSRERWREAARSGAGLVIVVGAAGGLLLSAGGLVLRGSLGDTARVIGLFLPILLLQDFWRYALFARSTGRAAAANDFVWVAILLGSMPWVVKTGTPAAFAFAWAIAGSTAGVLGMFQTGAVPRPTAAGQWWREHRELASRFLGEFTALVGGGQIALYLVGGIAGLAVVGALRAAQVPFGPFGVLLMGVRLFSVPEAVRRADEGPGLLRFCRRVSASLAGAALAVTVALLATPRDVGSALLGEAWSGARSLLLPVGVTTAANGVIVGAVSGLRALEAVRASFRMRSIQSLAVVVAAGLGAAIAGATGAAWGMAAVGVAGAVGWWIVLRREVIGRGGGIRTGAGVATPSRR